MTEKSTETLAREFVREVFEGEDKAAKLACLQYVLSRPIAAKESGSAKVESATLIVHLDKDGNLKEPPREGGNEAEPSAPFDPANWTELHAED